MALIHFGPTTFDADTVIFDKDGTLIDFDPVWRTIYLAAIDALLRAVENPATVGPELNATLGYDPAKHRFSTHGPFVTAANAKIGAVVAAVLYRHARPTLTWDAAEALAARTFLTAMAAPVDPALLTTPTDLPALFASLAAAGMHIAVITSDERAQTLQTLDILGVGQQVELVIASDDAYPPKPAPDAIWAVCRRLDTPLERAVMVGDSLTDIQMGRAAGVGLCVGVLSGPASREDLVTLADVVLESIGEMDGRGPRNGGGM